MLVPILDDLASHPHTSASEAGVIRLTSAGDGDPVGLPESTPD